jgi:hypothetical protein
MQAEIPKRKTGETYPLRLTPEIEAVLSDARQKTGITNNSELLRLAVARGLPILIKQLTAPVVEAKAS